MNGPIEPSGDMRVFARLMRQMYLALTQEDFTDHQALVIIGQVLAANGGSQS